jgi:hypothetical protein
LLIDIYVRRLKHSYPDAKISLYMGRGENTSRIHWHMVSDGVPEEVIRAKWRQGSIIRVDPLRPHNYYNGVDHGQDYTGLAEYLFGHWTPEQGGHHCRATKNLEQPTVERVTVCKREYSESKPPKAPKGYKLVAYESNKFGYQKFTYVREDKPAPPRKRPAMPRPHLLS